MYGPRGVLDILGTYDAPNNHLIFTVLQSLVPTSLLRWSPWTIRIFGVASGILAVAAVIAIAAARRTTPLLGVFLVAGSPLLVTYLFVARGYTFSAVFLVAAAAVPVVVVRPMLGACLGALALALGTWPLPTNLFVAPGWVLAVAALRGRRAAVAGAAVYAALVSGMFGPVAGQIWTQARVWNAHVHWWPWVGDLFNASSLVPECGLIVALAATVAAARRRDAEPLALVAFAMAASWFAVVMLGHAAGLHLPFVRTAVPAMWLAVVAVTAGFPRDRWASAGVVLLAPAFLLGVVLWTHAVRDGSWQRVSRTSRNDVLYGTTPVTIRDLGSVHADRIACPDYDSWVCLLAVPYLARRGVAVDAPTGATAYDGRLRCVLGSRRPPDPFQVSVYRGGALVGVLCH